ncbi:hypothetical protein Tsubulata_035306 [Turnera subulata]|uniref:DCD domain-containing protein n=1 Tax=Turnera subulata TaxID=218843 RepID=A0A9Q0J298_9ROSI|nr:hypothetical protein Tsubulata_035306 [Turnera subulata]
MPARPFMEFAEENGCPGLFPDCGAIFMSNRVTRKECLRRGLLGLPSGQYSFVKQVKAGMILFLFEFENRQLHGVFQASSDGALNIVPNAFCSTGKQFPAQVKFIPLWNCSPLREDEFRGAIRENYFSANKFNFGLSEWQVRRLLLLFSMRKLENKSLRRQFNQGKVPRPICYSTNKSGRVHDDDASFAVIGSGKGNADGSLASSVSTRFLGDLTSSRRRRVSGDDKHATHGVRDGQDANKLLVLNDHLADSFVEVGRQVDEGWFLTRDSRNEVDVDLGPRPVITSYPKHELVSTGRIHEDVEFASGYGLGGECNDGSSFRQSSSSEFSGSFLSNISLPSSNTILEANSLIKDHFREASLEDHLLGPHKPILHFSAPLGDTIRLPDNVYSTAHENLVTTHEVGVHALDNRQSFERPYFGSESPHNSTCPGLDSQPFPSYSEPKRSSICSNLTVDENLVTSSLRCELDTHSMQPLAPPPPYCMPESPCKSTYHPLDRQFFSTSSEPNLSSRCPNTKSPVPDDFPPSYSNHYEYLNGTDQDLRKAANPNGMARVSSGVKLTNKDAFDTTCIFQSDYNYGASSQEKHNLELLECKHIEAFVSEIREQGSAGHIDLQRNKCGSSLSLHSDSRQKRCSVFSRLALPQKEYELDERDTDSSVDEVMAMLHQSRYQWVKAKNYNQLVKKHNQVANLRNCKETMSRPKLVKLQLPKISEKPHMDDIPVGEDDGIQGSVQLPFLDFKRRREVRETPNKENNVIVDKAVSSSGPLKKRKLIRPKFGDSISDPSHTGSSLVVVPVQDSVVESESEIFSSNQCLASSQDNIELDSNGEGKDKEIQRMERVDKGFDLNLYVQIS